MGKRIEKIVLKNFKGATGSVEFDLDKNKPITLIFGENGTGKSTVLDAIDFVCNERYGSIMDRSVGKGQADYMPTLGTNKTQLEASITTSDGTWIGKIGARSLPTTTGPTVNRPKVEVLRRSRILSIINAQPKERYAAIKDFIEVPACEANERALRDAEKEKRDEFEDAIKAVELAQSTLKTLWEKEGKPESSPVLWAEKAIAIDLNVLDTLLTELESLILSLTACTTASNGLVKSETDYNTAKEEYHNSEAAYETAKAKYKGDVDALIQVLEEAQKYLQTNIAAATCPVCEQSIVPETLTLRIGERLTAMNEQVLARQQMQRAKKNVDIKHTILGSKQKDFRNSVISLSGKVQKATTPLIKNLKLDYSIFTKLVDSKTEVDSESINQANILYAAINAISNKLAAEKQSLSDTKGRQKALQNHLDTIKNNTKRARELETLVKVLAQILALVDQQRKKYVDELLQSIAGEVEQLYSAVHPSEGIGKIRWYLNPQFQGSLEFDGQFQNAPNVPPPAYYSESHLDTLGVCVFLALSKHNKDDNTVIILDDVVTSVDQVHMERFFRMLNEQAENFNQLIIGTHYRPWRDKYRYYSSAGSKVQLIELQHWSLSKGIRHTKTKFSIEELQEAMAAVPFDRQIVASKAGILLEGIMDRLGRQFHCKLPLKNDPDYTLSEYTGGFNSALKKLLHIERTRGDGTVETVELGKLVEVTTEQNWVRNQVGCHFNVGGMTISDPDVIEFGKRVADFSSSCVCGSCGEFPNRDKSGSYWECKCGSTKLFPLIAPN
jgi:energy-coupling factor transporter ATP-binding protein EcfA2